MRELEMVAAIVVTTLASIGAALVSKSIQQGERLGLYYLLGIVSSTTWLWMLCRSPWPPLVTSVVWDIFYTSSFTVVLIIMFGVTGWWQILGAAMVVAGLILMGK